MEKIFQFLLTKIEDKSFSDVYLEPAGSERKNYNLKGKSGKKLELIKVLSFTEGERFINYLRLQARISTFSRQPEEGYFATSKFAFRLTSLPGYFGDVLSLRVINRSPFHQLFSQKDKLKFSASLLEDFLDNYRLEESVFFAGKPSQGKTTTMFHLLLRLSEKGYRIITYEEPVEFVLDSILQFNRAYFSGIDVKNIYKYLLRLSPDLVVIGEMREEDDWQLAFQIIKAGIPLFSTFHSQNLESAQENIVTYFPRIKGIRLFFQELIEGGPKLSACCLF